MKGSLRSEGQRLTTGVCGTLYANCVGVGAEGRGEDPENV